MAKFLTPLTVTEIDDSVFEVAGAPFEYQSDLLPVIVTVPVGFYTDFASVPRWMPIMYALLGDTAHEPAVVHDWLYYTALTDREIADRVLLEAMGVAGLADWHRYLIYWGVRLGGFVAWNAHRKAGHPEAPRVHE